MTLSLRQYCTIHIMCRCSQSTTISFSLAKRSARCSSRSSGHMCMCRSLPASMLQLTDSPVPYIMGFYYDAMTTAHTLLEMQFEPQSMTGSSSGSHASICFVDIDRQQVDVPEDLPELPFSENLTADLERELARLESDLSSLAAAGDDVPAILRRLQARAIAGRLRPRHPSGLNRRMRIPCAATRSPARVAPARLPVSPRSSTTT